MLTPHSQADLTLQVRWCSRRCNPLSLFPLEVGCAVAIVCLALEVPPDVACAKFRDIDVLLPILLRCSICNMLLATSPVSEERMPFRVVRQRTVQALAVPQQAAGCSIMTTACIIKLVPVRHIR